MRKKRKRLSASEVSMFCEQIALLLSGGISIDEATYILYQEMEDAETKLALKEVSELVKENMPLYEALEKSEIFTNYMVHMVKIGETMGKLEEVMALLAKYYDRDHKVKESIRNVVLYPMLLFAMMGVLLLVMVAKILPVFQAVFHELDTKVSSTSAQMLKIGILLGKGMFVLVVVMFVVLLLLVGIYQIKAGKVGLQKAANYIPYIRRIKYKIGVSRFVSSMSLMIQSGLSSEESLELAMDIVEHPVVNKRIFQCLKCMRDHRTLDESLRESKLITGMNGRMVSVGVKTGVLGAVFEKLDEKYDDEVNEVLQGVATIIEAVMVLSLSTMVGLILLSVMLPLISIISSIG